jgi:hypothetical protein
LSLISLLPSCYEVSTSAPLCPLLHDVCSPQTHTAMGPRDPWTKTSKTMSQILPPFKLFSQVFHHSDKKLMNTFFCFQIWSQIFFFFYSFFHQESRIWPALRSVFDNLNVTKETPHDFHANSLEVLEFLLSLVMESWDYHHVKKDQKRANQLSLTSQRCSCRGSRLSGHLTEATSECPGDSSRGQTESLYQIVRVSHCCLRSFSCR